MNFCVYEHWRPDTNTCFYVGKGKKKRAYFLSRGRENTWHARIVNKLRKLGLEIEVRLIAVDLNEADAFELECHRILYWRAIGVKLVNMTTGGEGSAGAIRSAELRKRISKTMKGRPGKLRGRQLTSEHRAAISASMTGRVVSLKTRAKISAAQKGKPRPELIGRKLSEDGIRRLRERVFTDEHRARISNAKKGKPFTQEHREALKIAWITRKAEMISA